MIEQTFGPKRCRDTRKPLANQCPDVAFYRCPVCGTIFTVTGDKALEEKTIICCNEKIVLLTPVDAATVKEQIKLDYQITGGYNDNAIKVIWKTTNKDYSIEWIYLKTFTGGYLKYVSETKHSPMVFALADTDAFCYCDEDPCLECVFRCKRGFVIYAYVNNIGLLEIAIDKMNAQWQSKGK